MHHGRLSVWRGALLCASGRGSKFQPPHTRLKGRSSARHCRMLCVGIGGDGARLPLTAWLKTSAAAFATRRIEEPVVARVAMAALGCLARATSHRVFRDQPWPGGAYNIDLMPVRPLCGARGALQPLVCVSTRDAQPEASPASCAVVEPPLVRWVACPSASVPIGCRLAYGETWPRRRLALACPT